MVIHDMWDDPEPVQETNYTPLSAMLGDKVEFRQMTSAVLAYDSESYDIPVHVAVHKRTAILEAPERSYGFAGRMVTA